MRPKRTAINYNLQNTLGCGEANFDLTLTMIKVRIDVTISKNCPYSYCSSIFIFIENIIANILQEWMQSLVQARKLRETQNLSMTYMEFIKLQSLCLEYSIKKDNLMNW